MLPALPKILSDKGYETIAFDPNSPTFWNRLNVYYKLGFDYYYSAIDFDLNDMNGWALSDISLYKQAMRILRERHLSETPKFVYILTFTGHYPFLLNKKNRPIFIKSSSSVGSVDKYVNSIAYSTKEIMEFVKYVLNRYPDSLVVILGDHLPLLGMNLEAYVEGGILRSDREKFTAKMYQDYVSAPIIVIDGKNGPVDIGNVSMYELPSVILELLGLPASNLIDAFIPQDNLHIRTLEGIRLVIGNAKPQLCKPEDDSRICKYVYDWVDNVKVLERDILVGRQFSLEESDRVALDRFIVHAAGPIDSIVYSNSKEALEASFKKGFRFMELDFEWTSDGYLVLIHDWDRTLESLFGVRAGIYSLADFKKFQMIKGLTQLSLDDLARWLKEHPGVFIVTDVKRDNIKALTRIKDRFPELINRFIPQIYYFKEYRQVRNMGYRHIILTLYVAQYSDSEILKFVDDNYVVAVTMPADRALTDLPVRLEEKRVPVYAHTVNDPKFLDLLRNRGVFGVYTDFLEP
jgi:glycerophosphoryl diester phosphodiesterase